MCLFGFSENKEQFLNIKFGQHAVLTPTLIGAQMLRVVVVIVGVKAFWRLTISLKHQLQLIYNTLSEIIWGKFCDFLNSFVSASDGQEGDWGVTALVTARSECGRLHPWKIWDGNFYPFLCKQSLDQVWNVSFPDL